MPLDLTSGPTPPPATKRKPSPRAAAANSVAAQKAAEARKTERKDGLDGIWGLAAFGLVMAGQPADAGAFVYHGENVSVAAAEMAESNAQVARVIDFVVSVGPWAALLGAAMPLALQIMVNHKRIPESALPMLTQIGVMTPAAMEAKARADMIEKQNAMMQEAADAEARLISAMADAEKRRETADA